MYIQCLITACAMLINRLTACLLYANDLLLMSNNAQGLQASLNKLHKYCQQWGLSVNTTKTKILVF